MTPQPQLEQVIDLNAIAENVALLRRSIDAAGTGAEIMAVVKADGYNHGAEQVARVALEEGATGLGVTTIDEALALRRAGIDAPILSWLNGPNADYRAAVAAGVELGLSSPRQLATVAAAAGAEGVRADVTVKIDTGLNRNGVAPDEWVDMLDALVAAERAGSVRVHGAFTHLSHGDEPGHPEIDAQATRFDAAVEQLRERGLRPEQRHVANSAATLTRPDLHYTTVRPGIAMYGLTPIPAMGDFGLRPAMSLRTTVILVKHVRKGEGVSYGHLWVAPRDTTVALLPMGYADGLPRLLSQRFAVQLGGKPRRAIGRVCMDQFVVELGPGLDAAAAGGVREGDTAYLFGDGTHGEPTADAWAEELGTINYEIVCGPRNRATRTYVDSAPGPSDDAF